MSIKQLCQLNNKESIVICQERKCKSVVLYSENDIQKRKILDWKGDIKGEERFVPCPVCEKSLTIK